MSDQAIIESMWGAHKAWLWRETGTGLFDPLSPHPRRASTASSVHAKIQMWLSFLDPDYEFRSAVMRREARDERQRRYREGERRRWCQAHHKVRIGPCPGSPYFFRYEERDLGLDGIWYERKVGGEIYAYTWRDRNNTRPLPMGIKCIPFEWQDS